MADAAKWYVVHTYSGYENKVASSIEKAVENRRLHDLITAVNIPTEKVVEVKDGKSREVERKLYPGYVLVMTILTRPGIWCATRAAVPVFWVRTSRVAPSRSR